MLSQAIHPGAKTTLASFLTLAALTVAVANVQSSQPKPLAPGVTIEGKIKGGDVDQFAVSLKAGEYARIMVQRSSIDLSVATTAPNQIATIKHESPAGPESPMTVSIIARVARVYKVEVQPLETWAPPGHYKITLAEVVRATPQHKQRLSAELKVAAGRAEQRLGTKDSQLRAIDKYKEALLIWKALAQRVEEANALHFIAQAYKSLGDAYREQAITN